MAPYLAGRNAVLEAIRAGQAVRRVLIDSTLREDDSSLRDILKAASASRIPIERAPWAVIWKPPASTAGAEIMRANTTTIFRMAKHSFFLF